MHIFWVKPSNITTTLHSNVTLPFFWCDYCFDIGRKKLENKSANLWFLLFRSFFRNISTNLYAYFGVFWKSSSFNLNKIKDLKSYSKEKKKENFISKMELPLQLSSSKFKISLIMSWTIMSTQLKTGNFLSRIRKTRGCRGVKIGFGAIFDNEKSEKKIDVNLLRGKSWSGNKIFL